MWTIRKALAVSTVLQATQFAWADNAPPQNPTATVVPKGPVHASSRINFLNLPLLNETEKTGSVHPVVQPASRVEGGVDKGRTASGEPDHQTGFNWTVKGQRPALQYKFSDTGAVHFHFGRHGSTVNAKWDF